MDIHDQVRLMKLNAACEIGGTYKIVEYKIDEWIKIWEFKRISELEIKRLNYQELPYSKKTLEDNPTPFTYMLLPPREDNIR